MLKDIMKCSDCEEYLLPVLSRLEDKNLVKKDFKPVSLEQVIQYLEQEQNESLVESLVSNLVVANTVIIYNYLLEQGESVTMIRKQLYLLSLYGKTIINKELQPIESEIQSDFQSYSTVRKKLAWQMQNVYGSSYLSYLELVKKNITLEECFKDPKRYVKKFMNGRGVGKEQAYLLYQDIMLVQKIETFFMSYVLMTQYSKYLSHDLFLPREKKEINQDNTLIVDYLISCLQENCDISKWTSENYLLMNLSNLYLYYEEMGLSMEEIFQKITLKEIYGALGEDVEERLREIIAVVMSQRKLTCIDEIHKTRNRITNFYQLSLRKNKKLGVCYSVCDFTLADVKEDVGAIVSYFRDSTPMLAMQLKILETDLQLLQNAVVILENSFEHEKQLIKRKDK